MLDFTQFHSNRIYFCSAIPDQKVYISYFDINSLSITPLSNVLNVRGVKREMLEFEMSDTEDGTFFVCGFWIKIFKNNGGLVFQVIDEQPSGGNSNDEIYHTDTRGLAYVKDGEKEYLFIGNDGGVTKGTRNSPSCLFTFSNINGHGLYITQCYGLGFSAGNDAYFATGAQDNYILTHKYNEPPPWQLFKEGTGDGYEVVIHPSIQDYAYYITGGGCTASFIGRTLDGFLSFNVNILVKDPDDIKWLSRKPVLIHPQNPDIAYVGYQNIYKSEGWNENFISFFDHASIPELIQNKPIIAMDICRDNPDVMYVAYENGTWDSNYPCLIKTDNAQSSTPDWEILDSDINGMVAQYSFKLGMTDIAVAPDNPEKIWLTFGKFWWNYTPNQTRVLYSDNGGESFIDITGHPNDLTLPNVPVNCITVVPKGGDQYLLFIGTDLGIYYYDTENPDWIPFNNHLPPCIVNDIKYIENPGEPEFLRISTFGYGIWETLLDCSRSEDYEVITGPVDWNSDQVMHHNVYIENGGLLTITAKISFVQGTGIFVREGGQLHVNGGTLTSACGTLWNGVVVTGDPNMPFNDLSSHGWADFNGATVEHAIAGARTMGGEPDYINGETMVIDPKPGPSGGIITGTNSSFINNFFGVQISPCANPKNDRFRECTFEISSELMPPYPSAGPLISLVDVNRVIFEGCTFRTSTAFSPNPEGIGIYAVNSTFYVDALCKAMGQGGCTQWKRSEFSNFDYGVKALAFSPTRTFRVDQADLEANNTGIYASGVSAAQVTRNEFTILKLDTLSREHFGGLYLDFCNGYMVEDNVFSGPGGLGDDPWAIGLIINNSNYGSYIDADNEVYNNDFHTLNIGILAQNKNRNNSMGTNGLTLKCNDFEECRYDIAVTAYQMNNSLLGIKSPQGLPGNDDENPAGNVFSTFTGPMIPHDDYNYHNEGGGLTYFHHDQNYSSVKVEPSHYSNITPALAAVGNGYNPLLCCLSHFIPGGGGGGGIEDQKMLLGGYGSDADSVSNLLALLVDGGNTQQTNQAVVSSTPPEALAVYNDLIGKSPYLSDTVMVSAVKQESVLDAAMVTDILTENPQAAKSDTVLFELENRINPLSDDQMNDVMQGLYVTGAKEALESNLAGYRNDYSRTLNNIVRYYSGDTLSASPVDSIITWLNSSDYLWARYHQVFILNEKNDSVGTASLLGNLANSFPFTPEMIMEHQNYLDLINFYKYCRDSSTSILQPDSIQVSSLFSIVQDSTGLTSVYVTNLLSALGELAYSEPYLLPVPGLKESKIIWPKKTIGERNSIKIYPNPAGTYCVFEIEIKDFQTGATLEIADNQGRKIKSLTLTKNHDYLVYPLEKVPSGMYICSINSGGKVLKNAKLIVNK
jgi:hypothetical protein